MIVPVNDGHVDGRGVQPSRGLESAEARTDAMTTRGRRRTSAFSWRSLVLLASTTGAGALCLMARPCAPPRLLRRDAGKRDATLMLSLAPHMLNSL